MARDTTPSHPSAVHDRPALSALNEESLERVREALSRLSFGSVALTIHDGQVVQIDITEKTRLKAT